MSLLATLQTFCEKHAIRKCWIAYSGGMDSHVLLHACYELSKQTNLEFAAIHVNHQLSEHANRWAKHCRETCAAYAIDYHESTVQLPVGDGSSVEASARKARYAAFKALLEEGDLLLTAHHEDDQAETFLLQLLRGAGPKGLAAMPLIKPFAKGLLARPFLSLPYQEIRAYATAHQLNWVEDESNRNTALTRNYLRHNVMPVLKNTWQQASALIARSAANCAESQGLLEEALDEKWDRVKGQGDNTLSVSQLLQQSPAWQRALIRHWIAKNGFAMPEQSKLASIQQHVLGAARDKMPHVAWQSCVVRRYADDLYILPIEENVPISAEFIWDMKNSLELPAGALNVSWQKGSGLVLPDTRVTVRFRQAGDKVTLLKRGNLSLKNLFQEWRVPTWERGRVPLIFAGNVLVEAVGYFKEVAYLAKEQDVGVRVEWVRATD